jgi:hypothetical protein
MGVSFLSTSFSEAFFTPTDIYHDTPTISRLSYVAGMCWQIVVKSSPERPRKISSAVLESLHMARKAWQR